VRQLFYDKIKQIDVIAATWFYQNQEQGRPGKFLRVGLSLAPED